MVISTKEKVNVNKVTPNIVPLMELDKLVFLTNRVNGLKQKCEDAVPHICSDRSRLATESWKETDGEPLDIRRAKVFRRIMEGNPISIRPDELVVGSQSQYVRGASVPIECNPYFVYDLLHAELLTAVSPTETAEITEAEKESLLEDCKYWMGRSLTDVVRKYEERFPYWKDWAEANFISPFMLGGAFPPAVKSVDYGKVIRIGYEGIIAEAREALSKLDYENPSEDFEKDCFLQAVIIVLEGAIEYAHRYALLAEEMAAKEKDPRRKKELEKIAETCQQVPAKPARSFYEAVQSFWLTHICVNLENAVIAQAPGRLDQYLYPLYQKDVIEEGNITRQEAAEILGCLIVKFNEMSAVKSPADKENSAGTLLQDTTICGVTSDGKDASNELSYMLLEALGQVQMPQPPIYVRYHTHINPEIWMKAMEIDVRRGDGNPAFVNDICRVISFVDHGIPLEEARDWVVGGCAGSIMPNVAMHGVTGGIGYFNTSKILEFVLNNGRDPNTGKQICLVTGDPRTFTSVEQFKDAFKQQADYFLSTVSKKRNVLYAVDVANYRTPFCSSLLGDCIARGKDGRVGGVRYPQFLTHVSDRGLQNVADSLAAIKKVVFEEKKISMDELLDALKVNFKGKENIRQMLLKAPKYGNDDDYVDDIFNELSLWLMERVGQDKNPFGTRLWQGRSGATVHWMLGRVTGALPDGRKAGEPLADGWLSPSQGRDTKGPTAVLTSASKVNHVSNSNAALMNMKFDHKMLANRANLAKFAKMIETFFAREGYHIQVNMLSRETLLDAQEHPQQYKNLMVRVAGYSAYFVDLPRSLQDEIMSRTDQAM
jgi:pyruvate formate-lyase/glycerol dehydratase family glycyl radical enzyme